MFNKVRFIFVVVFFLLIAVTCYSKGNGNDELADILKSITLKSGFDEVKERGIPLSEIEENDNYKTYSDKLVINSRGGNFDEYKLFVNSNALNCNSKHYISIYYQENKIKFEIFRISDKNVVYSKSVSVSRLPIPASRLKCAVEVAEMQKMNIPKSSITPTALKSRLECFLAEYKGGRKFEVSPNKNDTDAVDWTFSLHAAEYNNETEISIRVNGRNSSNTFFLETNETPDGAEFLIDDKYSINSINRLLDSFFPSAIGVVEKIDENNPDIIWVSFSATPNELSEGMELTVHALDDKENVLIIGPKPKMTGKAIIRAKADGLYKAQVIERTKDMPISTQQLVVTQ